MAPSASVRTSDGSSVGRIVHSQSASSPTRAFCSSELLSTSKYLRTSEGRGFPGGWRFTGHDTQGLAEAGSKIPRIQLELDQVVGHSQ